VCGPGSALVSGYLQEPFVHDEVPVSLALAGVRKVSRLGQPKQCQQEFNHRVLLNNVLDGVNFIKVAAACQLSGRIVSRIVLAPL
jgi:hypothetical protein